MSTALSIICTPWQVHLRSANTAIINFAHWYKYAVLKLSKRVELLCPCPCAGGEHLIESEMWTGPSFVLSGALGVIHLPTSATQGVLSKTLV
eukprot:1011108-Pelagomonas_calceolata.AAC.2